MEGDPARLSPRAAPLISIHALRVEGDSTGTCSPRSCRDFYPRPPGGGRLYNRFAITDILGFLSTPSGWRATHTIEQLRDKNYISIHALRVEGDRRVVIKAHGLPPFLSTPSGWRATFRFRPRLPFRRYFYPRPPGGGRRAGSLYHAARRMDFYPRPPGGGRHFSSSARSSYSDFYPRPPGGGRQRRPRCLSATKNFYPRPPGGGRPAPKPPLIHTQRFLSTPSGWRATVVLEDHKVVEAGFLSTPSGWRATKGCTASAF